MISTSPRWEPREGVLLPPRARPTIDHVNLRPYSVDIRRTGLTLKEGQRDEFGMEEVDGIFSSPEKSPVKVNGFDDPEDEDSIGSEGMSMDEGIYNLKLHGEILTDY